MKPNWALIAITATLTLVLSINPLSYAFHANLGIDDNKASELYHSNPNDPAIVQWKTALQLAINGMGECFDISDFQKVIDCQSTISTIEGNCKSHPNTLIGCNDARLPQYPLVLQQARQAEKMVEEAQIKAEERGERLRLQERGIGTIESCIVESLNASSKFKVASDSCEGNVEYIAFKCNVASPKYDYCKDERLVWYIKQHNILNSTQHNILNSTVSPSSNLTGNSSSSNSTYP